MTSRIVHCPTCGERVSPTVGECLFCDPAAPPLAPTASPPAAPPPQGGAAEAPSAPVAASGTVALAPPVPAVATDAERGLGLQLFEAEEALARGQADKALVLVSRAVKERPDSLTAWSLYERARREVLKGKRRDKLERRIAEGERLFEAGRFAEAERIVTSALKLLPDHPLAQALLARLKERRLAAGSVEAETERELDRHAQARAHRTALVARAALNSGWYRKALVELRRGLRFCPDHLELLGLLREVQRSDDLIEQESTRRRALLNQIGVAHVLMGQGRPEESLKILRAVLREDPDNARAQAEVQEVRRVWLRRTAAHEPRSRTGPVGPAADRTPAASSPVPPAPDPALGAGTTPEPGPRDAEAVRRMAAARAAPRTPTTTTLRRTVQSVEAAPVEIRLPRTRRRSTPLAAVLAGAGVALGLVYFLVIRGGEALPASPSPVVAAEPPATAAPASPEPAGPLTTVEPDLRRAIETTLSEYGRALEMRDMARLAQSRPDLSAAEREARLASFLGAINVAVDLRVLDVEVRGAEALVPVLRTDVIVGGRARPTAPVEEVLRFQRRQGSWALGAARH